MESSHPNVMKIPFFSRDAVLGDAAESTFLVFALICIRCASACIECSGHLVL